MKLIVLLLTTAILQVSANSYGQRVTLNVKDAPLEKVFKAIRKQTNFDFFYTDKLLKNAKPVSLSVKDLTLNEALERCLQGQSLTYSIDNNIIVIQSKPTDAVIREIKPPTVITGKVMTEGLPFAGVVVREKANPNNQTATNRAGEFILTVNDERGVLQFSYIGYEPVEVKVSETKNPFTVNMKMSLNDLDQVQVTAYGTTTKRLNAGNITTISAAEIAKNPINNVMEALQGKVPGLFIQQTTGQPGGAFNIRLRNATNFAVGATPPLVIVDGVRYPAGTLDLAANAVYGTNSFLGGGSGLNYINPNDIESIDVLKDVDATAIYGSSGAYGVILISTKKSKMVSSSLNANVYSGVSVIGKMPKLLNTEEYLALRREAFANDGLPVSTVNPDVNGAWPADRYNDWQKEFLGSSAVTSNMNVSYSGGGQNTSYLISGSLRDMGNIQRHSGSNSDGSLRFALNTNTNDNKFSLSLTGTYLSSKNDMVPFDASNRALFAPNAPPTFKEDGTINWEATTGDPNGNSIGSTFNRTYKNITNNFLANATLVYKPTNKITLRSVFGYSNLDGKELIGAPTTVLNPSDALAATKAVSIFHHYNTRSITIAPYGEYHTTIGKKGEISFKLGGEIGNKLSYNDDIQGTGFPSDAFLKNPATGSVILTSYNLSAYRTIGMFGIIKLVWDNKYIIDINTRRDGSTKFGPGRRFGNFGSGALAWIFSEEGLVKNNLPFLSFGKLRLSSGVVGGDNLLDFSYLGTYRVVTGSYDGKVGLEPTIIPNPLLNWERNFNSEAGLELGFFKDRITTDLSYYYNRASNQLISQPISAVTGFPNLAINSDALVRTSGIEANLSSINIKGKNFNWSTRFNISFPKSKLLKVPSQSNTATNYVLNQPVTGIKLYKYEGVNPETGYYSFTNAKGVTSDYLSGLLPADKTEFIDLAPKYFGGLTNTFSYKQLSFDFTFNFTSRMARNILSQTVTALGFYGASGTSGTDLWLRRWQKPGDETDVPRVSTLISNQTARQQLYTASTGGYSDAKYARLQNASLRYNFGPKTLKGMHLKNLSIYAQGQNLFTISSFDGLDPENLNVSVIPPLRTFTFGLNLTL